MELLLSVFIGTVIGKIFCDVCSTHESNKCNKKHKK